MCGCLSSGFNDFLLCFSAGVNCDSISSGRLKIQPSSLTWLTWRPSSWKVGGCKEFLTRHVKHILKSNRKSLMCKLISMCTFSGGRGGRPYLCFACWGEVTWKNITPRQLTCVLFTRSHGFKTTWRSQPFRKVVGILQNILPLWKKYSCWKWFFLPKRSFFAWVRLSTHLPCLILWLIGWSSRQRRRTGF